MRYDFTLARLMEILAWLVSLLELAATIVASSAYERDYATVKTTVAEKVVVVQLVLVFQGADIGHLW